MIKCWFQSDFDSSFGVAAGAFADKGRAAYSARAASLLPGAESVSRIGDKGVDSLRARGKDRLSPELAGPGAS